MSGLRESEWTEAETKFAATLHRAGNPPEAIALALPGRTANAIKARLQRSSMWNFHVTKDNWLLNLRGKLRRR